MTTSHSRSLRIWITSAVGPGGLLDDAFNVLSEAVVGHTAVDLDAGQGNVGETDGVVGLGDDGFGEVFADFVFVDVEGGDDVYVADFVATDGGVHEAGDGFVVGNLAVLVDTLDEG